MTTLTQSVSFDTKELMPILNSVTSPIILLTATYHIIGMNKQALNVFKLSTNDFENKSLSDLPNGDLLSELFNSSNTLREWSYDENVYAPSLAPASHGWTILLYNISHYKRLVHNQSESMRFALHDLRSPLTAIQGFASMMDAVGELNEKQKYFIDKIFSGVAQMTALVENVQDAGRYDPDSGSYQLMRSPTDLGHIVRKIVDNRLIPAEKTLAVTVSVAEDLPIINADETMLHRAISNLVDNAIKYTPDKGSIHVSIAKSENKILVAVQDTGLGISPQNQEQLFERHTRIFRPEFKKIKGTGLGLFIVRSVARRHDGEAWVKSEEGQGSTFYISIPLEGENLLAPED